MNRIARLILPACLAILLTSCGNALSNRQFLTTSFLTGGGALAEPIPMSEFGAPDGASAANADFAGVLRLVGPDKVGNLAVIHDPLDLVLERLDAIRHLPPFEFALVLRGSDLIPIRRGVVRTGHPFWEWVLQPGRVWSEAGDGSWSRASLPFSLQERTADCTHNGMFSWLFDKDGNVSRVAYQISSETCGYLKIDMWGVVPAAFETGDVKGADAAIRRLDAHRAARLPVKPIALLGQDYPGVEPGNIGAVGSVRERDMTVYGFVVDGVHYRSDCGTRHGTYPHCDSLPLPSYSTAKSIFAGVALMRMEARHPGIASQNVASLVPQCPADRWADVSLENALDMATGNFNETGWEVDEDSFPHVAFLEDSSHATRIIFACTHFERRAEPGSVWVYHTSDTYVLGTALRGYVEGRHESSVDIYSHVIVEPIWNKLNLSPLLDDTKRTYGETAQPYAGYGLTYETDDIVRVARWLSADNGQIDGEPMLDEEMLAAALFRDANDTGVATQYPTLRYNNGFWGFNAAEALGCDKDVWVPFMSGYGGITVAMLPNDTIYYYFSDGYVHRWSSAVVESSKIRRLCE